MKLQEPTESELFHAQNLANWLLARYCWEPLGEEQICGVAEGSHDEYNDDHDFISFDDAMPRYLAPVLANLDEEKS